MSATTFNRLRTGDDTRPVLGAITAATPTNITGATNATPIVVTSASHGLKTGDKVIIAAVGGNTAANGVHTVTYVGANSFSLDGVAGNGSYTSGGTVTRIYNSMTMAQLEQLGDAANRVKSAPTDAVSTLAAYASL